jgi:hypothetical protein
LATGWDPGRDALHHQADRGVGDAAGPRHHRALALSLGTCEEAFGRDGALLDGVAVLPRWYCAAVPHDTPVWLRRPATAGPPWSGRGRRPRKARLVPGALAPQRVDQLAAAVPRRPRGKRA